MTDKIFIKLYLRERKNGYDIAVPCKIVNITTLDEIDTAPTNFVNENLIEQYYELLLKECDVGYKHNYREKYYIKREDYDVLMKDRLIDGRWE